MNVVLALFLLLITLPVFGVLWCLVRIKLGSPVLFRQKRPGLDAELFTLVKFRTMIEATNDLGEPLADGDRLTTFGVFLRSTSLDELPTLYNVLRGEMNFVGPRPLLEKYLPLYSREHANRHRVRPGITGWAQVNGRNAISWEDKLDLDIWYVNNQSLWLDMKILFMTIYRVLKRSGISEKGEATMSEFKGSKNN